MAISKLSKAFRFLFLGSSMVLWCGIWLTGFAVIHWILYVPASFFLFAAATGICPGYIISKMIFREKDQAGNE